MRWLPKFLLGLFSLTSGLVVVLALFLAGGLVGVRYLMAQIATNPPRPSFANDADAPPIATTAAAPAAPIPGGVMLPVVPKPGPTVVPVAASPTTAMATAGTVPGAAPSPSGSPLEPLPVGAYRAKVTLRRGLVVRSQPNRGGERVGSLNYNEGAIVLDVSPDKAWVKVRIKETGPEGWVRAGNVRRVEPGEPSPTEPEPEADRSPNTKPKRPASGTQDNADANSAPQ